MSQNFANGSGLTLPVPVTQGGTGVTTSTGSGANVLGTAPTINQPNNVGVTTNSNAAAGSEGEYAETSVVTGTYTTTVVNQNLNSITLPSGGDFEVEHTTSLIATAASHNAWAGGMSTTTLSYPANGAKGTWNYSAPPGSTGIGNVTVSGKARFSVTASTTVYLASQTNFAAAAPQFACQLSYRRIR